MNPLKQLLPPLPLPVAGQTGQTGGFGASGMPNAALSALAASYYYGANAVAAAGVSVPNNLNEAAQFLFFQQQQQQQQQQFQIQQQQQQQQQQQKLQLDEQIKRQKETHKAISSNLTYHHPSYNKHSHPGTESNLHSR